MRNRDQWIPISDDGSCAKTENFFEVERGEETEMNDDF